MEFLLQNPLLLVSIVLVVMVGLAYIIVKPMKKKGAEEKKSKEKSDENKTAVSEHSDESEQSQNVTEKNANEESSNKVDSYNRETDKVVYKDKESTNGFAIGEKVGEVFKQFQSNTNYQTKNITSPVESQYSASNNSKKNEEIKKEIPDLIIHPRTDNIENEESIMSKY